MKKEYSIGLFAITSIIILIIGYNFLKGSTLFDTADHYYIRYDEVNQLEISAKVYVNGFEVGTVLEMELDPEDADFMIVEIRLAKDISLPKNTVALLLSEGVFGGKAISLNFDQVCNSNDCLKDGDFIISGQKGVLSSLIGDPTELDAYISKIESGLSGTFNALNNRMDDSLSKKDKLGMTMLAMHRTAIHIEAISNKLSLILDQSAVHLSNSMINLSKITEAIAKNDNHLSNTISNIDSITKQLKDANLGTTVKNTNRVLNHMDAGLIQFTTTLDETKSTLISLNALVSNINGGEGTLGKLNTDPSLFVNLNESLRQLELLMQDLRLNPKRYINVSLFGKKQKSYNLPQNDPAQQ